MNQYGSIKATDIPLEKKLLYAIKNNAYATNLELAAAVGSSEKRVMEYISKMKRKKKIKTIRKIVVE